MTPAQETLYWRRWGAVAAANDWRMAKGRLVCDQSANRERSAYHAEVWNAATALALQRHCAVTADLLRHACHVVATGGKDVSHTKLNNAAFDKIVALWGNGYREGSDKFVAGTLIDPDHIDSGIKFSSPDKGRRERLKRLIKTGATFEYLDTICRDRFAQEYASPFWEDLPIEHLQQLADLIGGRTQHYEAPKHSSSSSEEYGCFEEAVPASDNNPF